MSVKQNYHPECEAEINRQINRELFAYYTYLSMSYFFDRSDIALPGFAKDFKKRSDEELGHAEMFMKYQNKRGGKILLSTIQKPERDEWTNGLEALKAALELEKSVNAAIIELRKLAEKHDDAQLCDFLQGEFLNEQVEDISRLGGMISKMQRVGGGLGEYLYDKEDMQGGEGD